MAQSVRRIEVHTDALGRVSRTMFQTVAVGEKQALEPLLTRLDRSLELVGCANVLCHEAHWVEETAEGWQLVIRGRKLQSLRELLEARQSDQEELICLSSDRDVAREQLLRYRDRLRLPDEAVIQLGLDICRGLEQTQAAGLSQCEVSPDTVYQVGGRWLLGDTGMTAEDQPDAAGLASLLDRLLGGDGSGQPPFGDPALRNVVGDACGQTPELSVLRRELERLTGRCPEPVSAPEPAFSSDPEEQDDSALQRLLDAFSDMEGPVELEEPKPLVYDWLAPDAFSGPEPPVTPEASEPIPADLTETIRKKVHLSTMISAGDGLTAALRKNGTVLSTRMFAGLDGWRHIRAVAVGGSHLLGLRSDGRVQVVGNNLQGQCEVLDWKDIVQIAAGATHSVGLRSDGTVVAAGKISGEQCYVYQWKNIAAIAAGAHHIVGLRSDGKVVAEGSDLFCQCAVSGWSDIVAISAGGEHTVGLRSDGTVVAAGANRVGQCNVEGWSDIIAVDAGTNHTVGLRADGTVVAVGSGSYGACAVGDWTDIIAISAGRSTTVGLRSDGKLLSVGKNDHGQCNVSHWIGLV